MLVCFLESCTVALDTGVLVSLPLVHHKYSLLPGIICLFRIVLLVKPGVTSKLSAYCSSSIKSIFPVAPWIQKEPSLDYSGNILLMHLPHSSPVLIEHFNSKTCVFKFSCPSHYLPSFLIYCISS